MKVKCERCDSLIVDLSLCDACQAQDNPADIPCYDLDYYVKAAIYNRLVGKGWCDITDDNVEAALEQVANRIVALLD